MYGGEPEYPGGRQRGHYDSGIIYSAEDPLQTIEADELAKKSLIYGIIGFLLPMVGFVLGPMAIKTSNKARAGGTTETTSATAGKVLGILTIIGCIFYLIAVVAAVGLPWFLNARQEALMNQ